MLRCSCMLGAAVVAGVWLMMLGAAPYVVAHDHTPGVAAVAAAATYVVGGFVCHQQAARSFQLWDVPMPVCARCTGLYGSAPLGIVVGGARGWRGAGRGRPASLDRAQWPTHALRTVLLASAAPTLLTVGAEMIGFADPTNLVRAMTALPLGFTVAWVVGNALGGTIDEHRTT